MRTANRSCTYQYSISTIIKNGFVAPTLFWNNFPLRCSNLIFSRSRSSHAKVYAKQISLHTQCVWTRLSNNAVYFYFFSLVCIHTAQCMHSVAIISSCGRKKLNSNAPTGLSWLLRMTVVPVALQNYPKGVRAALHRAPSVFTPDVRRSTG